MTPTYSNVPNYFRNKLIKHYYEVKGPCESMDDSKHAILNSIHPDPMLVKEGYLKY